MCPDAEMYPSNLIEQVVSQWFRFSCVCLGVEGDASQSQNVGIARFFLFMSTYGSMKTESHPV